MLHVAANQHVIAEWVGHDFGVLIDRSIGGVVVVVHV